MQKLLVVCQAALDAPAYVALERLLEDLPGLIVAPAVAANDAEAIRNLQQQHALSASFILCFERDQLFLCKADVRGSYGRERVALETSALQRRTGSASELQRACLGAIPAPGVRVLDVFAGWGMDGFSLATGGARVTCVEWQPAMVALARDAARRVPAELAARLRIIHGEARQILAQIAANEFDVIYLDPMFPARKKGALPNKRLQWLALLNGELKEGSIESLLDLAVSKARKQVVLKRRRKEPTAGEPVRQIAGSTVRYDIYTTGRLR